MISKIPFEQKKIVDNIDLDVGENRG